MIFHSVSHMLGRYYRLKRALSSARGLHLQPREIDSGRDTGTLERRLVVLATLARCMKPLHVGERFVLDALYGRGWCLRELQDAVKEAEHRRAWHLRLEALYGAPRTRNRESLVRIRREAEDKVEWELDRRGLLDD